jgi:DNA-binding transcriptional ArsR family regulator
VFSALSHDTRLRCLLLLRRHDELCVCDLMRILDLPQPHISRHLAQLRSLGIVKQRREGQWIHYRVSDAVPAWVQRMIDVAAKAAAGMSPYREDATAAEKVSGQNAEDRCR